MDFYRALIDRFGQDDSYLRPDWENLRSVSKELEIAIIVYALKRTRGNQFAAAKGLKMHRNTLRSRIKLFNLEHHPVLVDWRIEHGNSWNNPQHKPRK